ncbi:MAG: hypothetical protein ACOX3T_05190 [Bdellovibrionota bacterium]
MDKKKFIKFFSCLLLIIFTLFSIKIIYNTNLAMDANWFLSWVKEYANKGYSFTEPDYPPLYLHYLYLLSLIDNFANRTILVKFLLQLPNFITQFLFIVVSTKIILSQNLNKFFSSLLLMLIAFNLAIIYNSYVWGQVDIVPTFFVVLSILMLIDNKYSFLSIPFFLLGILTKFQMIAFFPLYFGLLLNRKYRKNLKEHLLLSFLISINVILLAFLPFILEGTFKDVVYNGYINASNRYNGLSLSASSIWVFASEKIGDHNTPLFQNLSLSYPVFRFITYKTFGMFVFSVCNFFIFLKAYNIRFKRDVFTLLTLSGLIFYLPLTAMHERYLIYTIPMVLIATIYNKRLFIISILLTMISFVNMYIWMCPTSHNRLILKVNCILLILITFWILFYVLKGKKLYFFKKSIHNN